MGKMKPNGRVYLLMNFFGAGLSCYGSWLINAIPFVVLEGTWALVAITGLVRTYRKSRKN